MLILSIVRSYSCRNDCHCGLNKSTIPSGQGALSDLHFPVPREEGPLAEPDRLGGNLHQFVFPDELDGPFQGHGKNYV